MKNYQNTKALFEKLEKEIDDLESFLGREITEEKIVYIKEEWNKHSFNMYQTIQKIFFNIKFERSNLTDKEGKLFYVGAKVEDTLTKTVGKVYAFKDIEKEVDFDWENDIYEYDEIDEEYFPQFHDIKNIVII